LGTRGSIHDGTDHGEVTMRAAEFAEIGVTAVDANADTNLDLASAKSPSDVGVPIPTMPLNLPSRQ
jgi:hypothetical protein